MPKIRAPQAWCRGVWPGRVLGLELMGFFLVGGLGHRSEKYESQLGWLAAQDMGK